MDLIIAEKPSVAADFARALGAVKHRGFYESQGAIITNCLGHLMELADPDYYSESYAKWNVEDLPIIPDAYKYLPIEETKSQLDIIKELVTARSYDRIIIATDAGREGELIARLVLTYHCKLTDYSNVYRFWSSAALTDDVIAAGLAAVKPDSDYNDLYQSGLYRQVSDWMIGFNFTRFFTKRLSSAGGAAGLFSFGRVQTAIVSLLVARKRQMENFKSEPYYNLAIQCSKAGIAFQALFSVDDKIDFTTKEPLEQIGALRFPTAAAVEKIENKEIHQQPTRLFNLTALQKEANRKLGFSADKTLNTAQALYETHKCLSYPRTPSRVLSVTSIELFTRLYNQFSTLFPDLFAGSASPQVDNTNIFNDAELEDHHALIPLRPLPNDDATEDEKLLFGLVIKSMATVLKEPYIATQTKAFLRIGPNQFVAKGTTIINQGWKPIKQDDQDQDEETDDAAKLPPLVNGETVEVVSSSIIEKKTTSPRPYTEATLLGVMEKHGLGTEATRAAVIEIILKREYCIRHQKNIIATTKAEYLIDCIQSLSVAGLKDFTTVDNTSTWEKLLAQSPAAFYKSLKAFVTSTFSELKAVDFEPYKTPAIGQCPLCKADIKESKTNFYCSAYKENNCPFMLPKIVVSHTLTPDEITALLSGKATRLLNLKSSRGAFKARLKLTEEHRIGFIYESSGKSRSARSKGSK